MTDTGGTPAGWYYAPGDPEGTHRYWDGAQWIGEPQPVPQAATPPPASPPPGNMAPPIAQQPGGAATTPPAMGASVSAPPGVQGFASGPNVGIPAEWSTRAIALLIDWGIGVGLVLGGLILSAIAGAIADVLGVLFVVVTYVGVFAYWIWNVCLKQGTTGQTIGKEKQGIKLVGDDTGLPVGAGMAFVRYLVGTLISSFTCGIYGLLDYLWPLWDQEKKRLTDKIVKMSVVTV